MAVVVWLCVGGGKGAVLKTPLKKRLYYHLALNRVDVPLSSLGHLIETSSLFSTLAFADCDCFHIAFDKKPLDCYLLSFFLRNPR